MGNDLSRRDAVKLAGTALTGAGLTGIAEGAPPTEPVAHAALPAKALAVPDFRGKIVVAYCRGRTLHNPVVLSDCAFEVQGGRLFLLGNDQPRGQLHGWTDGLRRAVSWESIEEYLVFESLEQYFARLQMPDDGVPSQGDRV